MPPLIHLGFFENGKRKEGKGLRVNGDAKSIIAFVSSRGAIRSRRESLIMKESHLEVVKSGSVDNTNLPNPNSIQ